MDVPEQEPKPQPKRGRKAKKTGEEVIISASHIPSLPPEERTNAGDVPRKKRQHDTKTSASRKPKSVEQRAEAVVRAPDENMHSAHTLPLTPESGVDLSLQGTSMNEPQEALSTMMPTNMQPAVGIHEMEKRVAQGKKNASIYKFTQQKLSVGLGWFINACATAILSVLLGFAPPVSDIPLLDFIERHKLAVLVVLCVVILLTVLMFLALPSFHERLRPMEALHKSMGMVTVVSILCCGLCLFLLWATLARPTWCLTSLTSLCPPPKTILQPITSKGGTHDTYLDVYFISFQSANYAIAGDPQKPAYIPRSDDPRSISVVPVNAAATSTPYTIAIGLHSLSTGRYNIVIDKVALLIKKVNAVPYPLNVYTPGQLTAYTTTNPARFVYRGQQASQTIPDTYANSPLSHVELASGEPDQIDAALESSVPVDIQFRIQVMYHIPSQKGSATLLLPQVFEVIFSNVSDWHTYRLNLAQRNFVPVP